VSPYDLVIAKVMVVMNEAVVEGLKGGMTDHFEFREAELREFSLQWG